MGENNGAGSPTDGPHIYNMGRQVRPVLWLGEKEKKAMQENTERVKKGTDPFDGRMTYEADPGEVIELEVDTDNWQAFICTEGRDCRHCDFNFLSFDYCLNFPCLAVDRQDGKDVHFVWRENA